jgi:hypothetical protein
MDPLVEALSCRLDRGECVEAQVDLLDLELPQGFPLLTDPQDSILVLEPRPRRKLQMWFETAAASRR